MVESISPPDSRVIPAFGQLIAVTKFGMLSPLSGPQILERYCAILSRCVTKGPISETVQDRCNSGPFKSKIVCFLALAVIFISLVT